MMCKEGNRSDAVRRGGQSCCSSSTVHGNLGLHWYRNLDPEPTETLRSLDLGFRTTPSAPSTERLESRALRPRDCTTAVLVLEHPGIQRARLPPNPNFVPQS